MGSRKREEGVEERNGKEWESGRRVRGRSGKNVQGSKGEREREGVKRMLKKHGTFVRGEWVRKDVVRGCVGEKSTGKSEKGVGERSEKRVMEGVGGVS